MEALTNVAFAGYAYYSAAGDGFVYALRSKDSSATGSPVILVDPTAKAAHFFPCLFLVAGGTLMVSLLAFVVVAFCCQRKVAKLEETYWKLQHTFADVNDTLVREVSRRTSAAAATSSASLKQRCTSKSNSQRVAGSQSPPPMPQHRGSTARMTSIRQPQHIREQPPAAPVFPATPSPYGMNPNPPYLQPMNVSPMTMHNFSYNDNCVQAALFPPQALPVPLSPSQHHTRTLGGFVAPQSTCLTPDQPLRRRASKVSFVGA
ncbi:hypothetical protein Q4I30_000934 [Leishmania utingensis]|uniref:Uncharacterized protein n=1 Tax=Leishmania utingensis TaxID=653362 RepID=A0AAW3AZU0_9TRYP